MTTAVLDAETDQLVREYAEARQLGYNDAVRTAIREAVERERDISQRRRAARTIVDELAAVPRTGLKADKAFYDSLNDE